MSTSYTAYTIIGSMVDVDDFWTKIERSVHEGCGEVGAGPYCQACGKSIHSVEVDHKPIDGYEDPNAPNIKYHGRIHGVDVLQADTAEGERFFVGGAVGECKDYDYSDKGVLHMMVCHVASFADVEERVRTALTKADMWDPSKFGIWTVLDCSY